MDEDQPNPSGGAEGVAIPSPARVNLRPLVGGFMRRGRPQDLDRLRSVVSGPEQATAVLYLAMSHVLADADRFPRERLDRLLCSLPLQPDEVDRAMLLLCRGEQGEARRLLDTAAAEPRLRRKATVWRLYLRGRQALAEGTYASDESIPTY